MGPWNAISLDNDQTVSYRLDDNYSYKGKEWESIRVGSTGIAGVDLSAHFAPPTIQVGEEKKEKPNLVALLGLPKNMK